MIHEREDYNKRVQCIDGSIPDDEPVFLLRGTDPHALETIRHWVKLKAGSLKTGGKHGDNLKSVIAHAERMHDYYLKNKKE